MGGRRFKVVDRSTKDGYVTSIVEFLHDVFAEGQELLGKIHLIFWKIIIIIISSIDLQQLHDRTRALAVSWFNKASEEIKAGILSHYGAMPPLEQDYWTSPSGPAWTWWVLAILPLDSQAQVHFFVFLILNFVSLQARFYHKYLGSFHMLILFFMNINLE